MPKRIAMDDLSTAPLGDVIDVAELRLDRRFKRDDGRYSVYNGTVGFPTSAGTWVRLAWRRAEKIDTQSWTGFEAAGSIVGVPRPQWLAAAAWVDPARDVVWRADEMTLVTDPALSSTGAITSDPHLTEQWWIDLHSALNALAGQETDRVCMSQVHLSTRIREVYGDAVDTTVPQWATAHGDIGWANLCGPSLVLLDWESWGRGPRGWDAACLWSASLQVPEIAGRVLNEFDEALSSRSGKLCRLLLCANSARAARRTGKPGPDSGAMAAVAEALLVALAAGKKSTRRSRRVERSQAGLDRGIRPPP